MILFLPVSTTLASAQTVAIDHKAVGCVVADKFPRFEAKLTLAENIGASRVVFQPAGSDQWWSVAMRLEGA